MTHISSLVPSLCQIFVSVSPCYTNSCVFFWWSLIFCALRAFGIVFMSCYPDVSTCLLSVYVTSVWLCLNPRAFPPDFFFVFVDIGILYSGFALATIKAIYVLFCFVLFYCFVKSVCPIVLHFMTTPHMNRSGQPIFISVSALPENDLED